MQTKGKKKIIDNAGALQKKYAWKSEKTQDTKKAPQDTKKQAAVCPYAKKCGGCDYQGMSYEQQLQEKQTYVRKNIGDYCKVLPIIGMENPYHYRNKVHAVFDVERRGKHANGGRRTAGNGHAKAAPGGVISGVYKAGTHEVINIDSCEIEDELSSAIIRDIRGLLHSFKIKTYDEDTGYGLLRARSRAPWFSQRRGDGSAGARFPDSSIQKQFCKSTAETSSRNYYSCG